MQITKSHQKAILVGFLCILLLGSMGVFIGYRSQIRDAVSKLEGSKFIVTRFDIVNSTPNSIIARGEAHIEGSATTLSSDVSLRQLSVDLYNGTEDIASLAVPLSSLSLQSGIGFNVTIPISQQTKSGPAVDILTNIMTGKNFIVHFRGELTYSDHGIAGTLRFSNILHFILDQPALSFDLQNLDLYATEPLVNFSLFNPFSVDLHLSGQVQILINQTQVAQIDLQPTRFLHNWSQTQQNVTLLVPAHELLGVYFQHIHEPIQLQTSLILGLDGLTVNVHPDLVLATAGLDLSFTLWAINRLNIDLAKNKLDMNVNASISSGLPVALYIGAIQGDLSSNAEHIGTFQWNSSSTEFLAPGTSVLFTGINITAAISQASILSTISSEYSFSHVHIQLFVDQAFYSYYIDT